MKKGIFKFLIFLPALFSCADHTVKVKIWNDSGVELGSRVVEIPGADILERLNSGNFFITDEDGKEIPSQFTKDSLILFTCNVSVGENQIFIIHPSDKIHHYQSTVEGNFYPKRRDDLAYENEVVGFRIYGPGTEQAGEKSYGYDLFLKYPTEELVVPQLYAAQTDDTLWAKVDSLRKIDRSAADEFERSFSYHVDHGKGMDCYAVGSTLGAGVAALLQNDSILFPWCYQDAEIIDNGPLRFKVALKFKLVKFGEKEISEHRIITLDSGSHLNMCEVWYDGLDTTVEIVAGVPRRDDVTAVMEREKGVIAYSDPTQGKENGRILIGLKSDLPVDSVFEKEGHILMLKHIDATDTFKYKWGFAWDKTDISTMSDWLKYLESAGMNYSFSLQ